MRPRLRWLALLSFLGIVGRATAFDPPVDAAGPLTALIEGPSLIEQTEKPFPVRIILENNGDQPLRGTVELQAIDRWRVEPAKDVPFVVRPKEKTSLDFRAVAGKGSYSAFYPLHAFVRFTRDDKPEIAHPILIVETRLPDSPRQPSPAPETPVAARPTSPDEPTPTPFPPKDDTAARTLGTIGGYKVRLWLGRRGLLDAAVGFTSCEVGDAAFSPQKSCRDPGPTERETVATRGTRTLYFHGFEIVADGARLDDHRAPAVLRGVKEEPIQNGVRVRHCFRGPSGDFELVGLLWVDRGALRAKFSLENAPAPHPWQAVYLQDVALGAWSERARAVYAGHGNVVRGPQAGEFPCDGHQLATRYVGFDFDAPFSIIQAVDAVPDRWRVDPDRRHYSLHTPHAQTLTVVPATDVWRAVRVWRDIDAQPAANGVQKLAGRFTFDLWGGRYRDNGEQLKRAFRYGLTNAVVVCHYWQRWEYDNRLPEIYPPNPRLGTTAELQQTIQKCRDAGVLFALHDNYIDYYPDAEGFSYEKVVAFDANSLPMKAWFNPSSKVQSYRYRADAIEPCVARNLSPIAANLAPTAYFIDVWSSGAPYDHWTADGTFVERSRTQATWARCFDTIRRRLGNNAPQISESGTDLLLGHLDGAQTNHMRVDKKADPRSWCAWLWKCDDAERIPWFDAAHHDRFVLQGAGYSDRYAGGLDIRSHGIYSDDYTATCILTGHPEMAADAFGRDVVRKYWLTDDLMRALAMRRIESVEFDGGRDGDIHRQHVRWSGGGDVWVNRGDTDWAVAGRVLPPYGFFARISTPEGTVEASLERRDGAIVEMARSARRLYVNVRRTAASPARPDENSDIERRKATTTFDFGPVATSCGCRLSRDDDRIVIMPLPETGQGRLVVRINAASLGWPVPSSAKVEAIAEDGKILDRRPIRREGDAFVVECAAGAFEYRIREEIGNL